MRFHLRGVQVLGILALWGASGCGGEREGDASSDDRSTHPQRGGQIRAESYWRLPQGPGWAGGGFPCARSLLVPPIPSSVTT